MNPISITRAVSHNLPSFSFNVGRSKKQPNRAVCNNPQGSKEAIIPTHADGKQAEFRSVQLIKRNYESGSLHEICKDLSNAHAERLQTAGGRELFLFSFFPFRPWPVTRRVPFASMGLIVIAVSPLGVVDLAQWAFIRRSVSACSHAGRPGRPLRGLKEAQKTAARAYFTPSCQSRGLVKMW
ncbi:hypothetical protein BDV41DRAFT_529900 [Aspergillus transmontanensis]|uniref:Uncharacterized protein n=1 Tax=Aspergillus transmontanensis TaxID=1034304 RepID=A0A5N6W4I6_9EURO|nr:hypothetical protein BDV41DRAFT_529900 [Aspergillus transmontanensis]